MTEIFANDYERPSDVSRVREGQMEKKHSMTRRSSRFAGANKQFEMPPEMPFQHNDSFRASPDKGGESSNYPNDPFYGSRLPFNNPYLIPLDKSNLSQHQSSRLNM